MKKTRKRVFLFAALIILLLLIIRCSKEDDTLHPVTVPENVASVVVFRYTGGTAPAAKLQYTDPDKIRRILDYLTTVELKGDSLDDNKFPTGYTADAIILYAADGSEAANYSVSYFAFCRSEGDWYSIDYPEHEYFLSLLNELEPDTAIKY